MRRVLLAVAAGAVVAIAPRSNGPSVLAGGAGLVNPTPSPSPTASPSTPAHRKHVKPTTSPSKSTAAPKTSSPSAPRSSTPHSSAPAQTSRTITGPVVSNGWGPIQVQVTVKGTQITAVSVPVIPQDGRSQFINARAVPILTQEAVQAQSAQVDAVSGATDTSDAFMQSLAAALQSS
jgi:uncharacterized protein with FMN-binding domain